LDGTLRNTPTHASGLKNRARERPAKQKLPHSVIIVPVARL
jgi:hypothetical protein